MKLKAFLLSLILCLAIYAPAIAQDELDYRKQTTVDLNNNLAVGLSSISNRMQEVTRGIGSTPYFDEDWSTGIALLPNSLKTKHVPMLFDMYQGRVYYKDGDNMLMLDNNRIEGFALKQDEQWIIFKKGYNSNISDLNTQTFFRVVHEGKTKILVHHHAYVRDSHKPTIATGSTTSKEFRSRDDYYLQTEDGKFYDVKNKEKRIVRKLERKFRDQVRDYADKNDLEFDEDKDLAKIMTYYDELISQKTGKN